MYDTLLPGHAAPYVCKYSPTSSIRLTSSNNSHAIVQIFIIPLCSECHISIAQDSDLLQFYKFASSGSARQETVNLPLSALRWLNGAHFFSFWRNLSDDDVCVQRNAFCAVKALPQNAQIFIAKKSSPSFYRDGIGSVCHFSLSPWDEDDSRWIKAFGDAFIDGAVEHHHQRMNCKLTSSGDAILEEVAKIRNRMSEN